MATLKDVAEEAGLAVSTVSRIMNNRGYISDNARQRVDEAIKKLNYQPNELARSLQKKTSNTIGLIVPHIQHPYFSKVISEIERVASLKGYKLILCNSKGLVHKEQEALEMCMSNRVAAVIICTGAIEEESLCDLEIPIIGFERYLKYGEASVECDNTQGGILAANHLMKKGCKHLLHMGDLEGEVAMPADDRGIGFQRVCTENGIDFHSVRFELSDYEDLNFLKALEAALDKYPETDGIFANNDILAAQAIQIINKKGKTVPDDIKIIGFDDCQISMMTSPRLTTIHQPVKEMAELALQMVENYTKGKMVPKRTILPVEIIEREST
ncbi:MAG: LacI family DNA-binding transcriptional regulator [Eubacteriales bacterium]|nr:LacI family DNA-binding transcriptional regulator [Eubacteriales bacterium]